MKRHSLLLTGPRNLEWVEEELPPPGPREVLIRTDAGAISVGSELPLYRCDARRSSTIRYPLMTGYESVGTVVEVGTRVRDFSVGERVVAFYGHRTHAVIHEDRAVPVPDGVSDGLALLVILTCDVAKGVRKVSPRPEEPVLITGGGAIGILTLFVLRAYGVRSVDLVEPQEERRSLAAKLGARKVMAPETAADEAGDYPFGFECSARGAAFSLLQEKARHGGRICVLSDGNLEPLALSPSFHEKELTVVGSSDGWDYHEHARWYFEVIRDGCPELEDLFESRVEVEELPETFEKLASDEISPLKLLVDYGHSSPG
jgi:alcohol dehydrogenase